MKALGSKHADDLDAYSTHYWQLTDWLASEFTVNNALPVVVKQIIPKLKDGWPYQLLRAVPSWLINLLTPLSPGFVFVLEKPA